MRFFLLELRARMVDAVIATSLDGKLRLAVPVRRGWLDAKCCAASAIDRVELLRGMRGRQARKRDVGLGKLSFAILCQSLVPLAELACKLAGECASEGLINGHRVHPTLDAHPIELAANH